MQLKTQDVWGFQVGKLWVILQDGESRIKLLFSHDIMRIFPKHMLNQGHHTLIMQYMFAMRLYVHDFICWSLPPSLTSPTCDSQKGSDPLTPAGTHKPLPLVDFSFMLAGQTQDGKREGGKQRKENKYQPEAKYRKRKNPIHLSLNLVINDHQLGLGGQEGEKNAPPGSHVQVSFHLNIATFVRKLDKTCLVKAQKEFVGPAGPSLVVSGAKIILINVLVCFCLFFFW